MLRKYFTHVPLWLSILVNIILGILASGPFVFCVILINGLFSKPSIQENLIGWCIVLATLIIILAVNFVIYYICKKKQVKTAVELDRKKIIIRFFIILILLVFFTSSFFTFPDLMLTLYHWWF